MSRFLRPLAHMSLFILSVCFRGESNPVPIAQSSGKFDQSSPAGLQDPQNLQELQLESAHTQLLLRLHTAHHPHLYLLPLGFRFLPSFQRQVLVSSRINSPHSHGCPETPGALVFTSRVLESQACTTMPSLYSTETQTQSFERARQAFYEQLHPSLLPLLYSLCACILCSLLQLSRRLSLFIA